MLATKVLNGRLERRVGTVDATVSDPEMRATIRQDADPSELLIENRTFKDYNRYFLFSQGDIDKNPKLEQNDGY